MSIYAPPPVGSVVQVVSTNFGAVATGTTLIPFDDTIPQITEGVEYMTQAITPKSTTNILQITTVAMLNSTTTDFLTAALFQDSTANALAANSNWIPIAGGALIMVLTHTMTAGTVSSTTFRLRAGTNSAATVTFNGQNSARRFGGITVSNISIIETKA